MSSNVGLSTPRGSGTSGYVQRNLSHLKPREHYTPYSKDAESSKFRQKKADDQIIEHEERRQIEAKVFEKRVELEDKGVDEEEIETVCSKLRDEITKDSKQKSIPSIPGRQLKSHQVHEMAKVKTAESERLRKALGIRVSQVEKLDEQYSRNTK